MKLTNKRILLGVTGGIAAYKSADLVRRFQDEGADVRVVMTSAAQSFITPLTMQALSNHPVHLELMDPETESVMGHIELARWADILVIAPATADFIARHAFGHGDDLLTTICLAATSPVAIAPAMNQAMWAKASTQENVATLRATGVMIFEPEDGLQACGETGPGRLMETPAIVNAVTAIFKPGILEGRHVIITAGPTREAIDPVRYISNHSSGKQGYALAEASIEAGARVTLVSGPTSLTPPDKAEVIPVESADDMYAAVMDSINTADIFIGVAAVADYKPRVAAPEKLKKQGKNGLSIDLIQNPDILGSVSTLTGKPFTVGFAAETENVLEHARSKLKNKNLDMIVANNVADESIGFNSDDNQTTILTQAGEEALPKMSKEALARKLVSMIADRLAAN